MPDRPFDFEKLKDLFHYVIKAAGARPRFGAVKLYKVAWFSDAKAYSLHGKSITGATYTRQKYGPVPKAAMPARGALEKAGAISQTKGPEKEGWRFRALTNPSVNRFTSQELAIINHWIKHIDEDFTAEEISDESHDYGWEIAKEGEELPIYAFLASRLRQPTDEEFANIRERAKELGLI